MTFAGLLYLARYRVGALCDEYALTDEADKCYPPVMCTFSGRNNFVMRLQNVKVHDINIELSIYVGGGSRLAGRGVSVSRSHDIWRSTYEPGAGAG